MKLNRILAAIADWISSLVWWREGEVHELPYVEIQRWRFEDRGVLLYVLRNKHKCPRDVGTMMYCPLRTPRTAAARDIHFCVDHLEGMARTPFRHTHQIAILSASHWPDEHGNYDYEELFVASADLQGKQPRRDLYVRCILHEMTDILKHARPEKVRWDIQFDIARKACMGSNYNGPPSPYQPENVHPYPLRERPGLN